MIWGTDRRQWPEDALRECVDIDEAMEHLGANYERLVRAQELTIASLEGLVAENQLELNRQTGIIARQRLTIQEQGETIKELRDHVAGLLEHINYLNSSPVSPEDLERLRALLGEENDG